MPLARSFQNNFTTGVISPAMYARIDLAKYASGCESIVNGVVLAHGGIANRPGTRLVDILPGNGILIPFVYSVEQAYALCFLDRKMRIYKEGGAIVYPDDYEDEAMRGEIVEVPTPYPLEELPKLKFTQSADTMFFAHPAHPPMTLTRTDHHEWEFKELSFSPTVETPVNLKAKSEGFVDPSISEEHPNGTGGYRNTTCEYKVAAVSYDEVESLPSLAVETRIMSPWPSGAKVTLTWDEVENAVRYEVYKDDRGWWAWIGSAEENEFVDDYIEGDDATGPKQYRNPFAPLQPPDLKAEKSRFPGNNLDEADDKVLYFGAVSYGEDRSIHSLISPLIGVVVNRWGPDAKLTLKWRKVEDAKTYVVYQKKVGDDGAETWYTFPEQEATELVIAGEDELFPGSPVSGPPDYGPGKNYPGAVGIYQQRLVFGRSDNEPQTVWTSETGAFDSMSVAQPMRADSAITVTVDSRQMNEIRHFVPLKDMLVLSSGAEIVMSPGANSDAITPTSIRFDIQSYWGASDVPPLVVGNSILSVLTSGKVVRDLFYQLNEDGYAGSEVSILAEHLLNSPVVSWAYQLEPFSTVWICLRNGGLLTFTYMREQEIWAWSEHRSEGAQFRSVTVVRENEMDNVYLLVERDGRFLIEQQVVRSYGDPVEKAFFVDCGLSYEGEPIAKVTGLAHLAGKSIAVLADGSVVRGLTVAEDGSFELPFEASHIQAGLPYEMVVKTVDPELRTDEGVTVGQRKNTVRARFLFRESSGLDAGPDAKHLTVLKFPVPEVYGAPPQLYSGPLDVDLPGLNRRDASVTFRQADPLPVTVLGVVTTITVE